MNRVHGTGIKKASKYLSQFKQPIAENLNRGLAA